MADKDKGSISVAEAGRRGGAKVREKYGVEHYSAIGKKGGKSIAESHVQAFREVFHGGFSYYGQRRLPVPVNGFADRFQDPVIYL